MRRAITYKAFLGAAKTWKYLLLAITIFLGSGGSLYAAMKYVSSTEAIAAIAPAMDKMNSATSTIQESSLHRDNLLQQQIQILSVQGARSQAILERIDLNIADLKKDVRSMYPGVK